MLTQPEQRLNAALDTPWPWISVQKADVQALLNKAEALRHEVEGVKAALALVRAQLAAARGGEPC